MDVVRRILAYWRVLAWAATAGILIAAYLIGAAAAWNGYRSRISSDSLTYDGHFEFTGQDFLSPMDSNVAFSGGVTKQPSFAASLQFLGNWFTHDYTGEARLTSGNLYFNISAPQMPVIRYRQSGFLVPLTANTWYQASLGDSLYDNICDRKQSATVGQKLEFYRALKTLKVQPSLWVNFFASRGGHHAVHLSGSVSGAQIAALYDAARHAEPQGCDSFNTLGFSTADLKHVTAHLDLYAAPSRDEVVVTLSDGTLGAKASMVLATYKYNQPVTVSVPEPFISLNAIYATINPATLQQPEPY
jgi:hypothetical protein